MESLVVWKTDVYYIIPLGKKSGLKSLGKTGFKARTETKDPHISSQIHVYQMDRASDVKRYKIRTLNCCGLGDSCFCNKYLWISLLISNLCNSFCFSKRRFCNISLWKSVHQSNLLISRCLDNDRDCDIRSLQSTKT